MAVPVREGGVVVEFPILIFIFTLIAIGFVITWKGAQSGRWNNILSEVAKTHRLTYTKGGFTKNPVAGGDINGFTVSVFLRNFSHGRSSTLTVGFKFFYSRMAAVLDIAPEGFWKRAFNLVGSQDIQLHDFAFDDQALVAGSDVHRVRALLHPEAKRLISAFITKAYSGKFKLQDGELEMYIDSSTLHDTEGVLRVVKDLLRLGTLVTREGPTADLLRENFKAERSGEGRMAYLESLRAVAGPLSPDDEIVRQAIASDHPPLGFLAVRSVGPAADGQLPQLFRAADRSLAVRILAYMEERRIFHLVPEFIALAGEKGDWTVRAALARFLASTGHAAAEEYLRGELALVTGGPGVPVPGPYVRECVRALGRCGSRDAVPCLYGVRGVFYRRDVREAIAAIQARLGLDEEGMLSLFGRGEKDGALSLNDDDGKEPASSDDDPAAG